MPFARILQVVLLLTIAAAATSPREVVAQAMTVQQLYACMLDANPTVREPCIRAGLQAQDPNIRAAGLAAVFRHRNTIVIEFEVPQSVQTIQARVDKGELEWRGVGGPARAALNLIEASGQRFSFRMDEFDNQSNTFKLSVRDLNFNDVRSDEVMRQNRRGEGTISGETIQISFRYRGQSTNNVTGCSANLAMANANELRGTVSCASTGGNSNDIALPVTAARMRFF